MNSNFTENDILQLIYDELEPSRAAALMKELKSNPVLNAEYVKMKETAAKLDAIGGLEPDDTSVSIVLDYSNHFHSEPEHS